MKNASTLWGGLKNYMYTHYSQDSGKLLLHAGLITWVTASLSQIFAIAVNDKVPSEQKKFLIPQEIADGALNVLAFYFVTNSMKKVASKLASTGKWSTKSIRDFVAKKAPETKMGDLSVNLSARFKEDKEFHGVYDKFKGGMEMVATVSGAVISSNIVTPFIRNSLGAKQQKKSLERERAQVVYYKTSPYKSATMRV